MSIKEPFEQFNELNQLTSNITKRTTEYMLGAVNGLFNDTASTMSEFSNIKKMEDVIAAQTRIASEMGNKFLKNSQEALNVWQANAMDVGKFMENCGRSMGSPMSVMNINPAKASSGTKGA